MPAVLLPVFHHNSCLLDSPHKRLDAFWRKKRTAVSIISQPESDNKASLITTKGEGRIKHISHTRRHCRHTPRQITGVTQKVTPRIPTTIRVLHVTECPRRITRNKANTPYFNTRAFASCARIQSHTFGTHKDTVHMWSFFFFPFKISSCICAPLPLCFANADPSLRGSFIATVESERIFMFHTGNSESGGKDWLVGTTCALRALFNASATVLEDSKCVALSERLESLYQVIQSVLLKGLCFLPSLAHFHRV